MPRLTRSSSKIENKSKENVDLNLKAKPKTPRKRKNMNTSDEFSSDSSPAKSTRSRSKSKSSDLSPGSSTRSGSSSNGDREPAKSGKNSSSRSSSLSPFRGQFSQKLQLSTPGPKPRSVRRALADNSELRLPGREPEYEELTSYLRKIASTDGSGSLYISGAPGTGKTATLLKIVNSNEFKDKFKIAFINCTGISSIGAIYNRICFELKLKVTSATEKNCLMAIEKHLTTKHKMTLLVLDEIDQLSSAQGKQLNVLYHIFEWPSIVNSKLVLVGIANSLDLTDRLLVRLQNKCELKPKPLHFAAYTKNQIVEIFKSRLEESGVSDLFPPTAIQLLAAKVAAVSGDVRRALNIGKRVVELAELERKKNVKALDMKKLDSMIETEATLTEEPEKDQPIQLKEVVSVLNDVYGKSQNLGDENDNCFPIQQKILICTILLILKYDTKKIITAGRLHEVFKKACKTRNISATDFSDFLSLCMLAESQGIIRVQRKKEQRLSQVQMQWDIDEVHSALKDKQMIENILSEKRLLSH